MYAVPNVKKFLRHKGIKGRRAQDILRRINEVSEDGAFHGSDLDYVMDDPSLSHGFREAMQQPEYIAIASGVLERAMAIQRRKKR